MRRKEKKKLDMSSGSRILLVFRLGESKTNGRGTLGEKGIVNLWTQPAFHSFSAVLVQWPPESRECRLHTLRKSAIRAVARHLLVVLVQS